MPNVIKIDAKLPIRLRLGIPGSLEVFKETKSQKISRKRNKNRGSYEQVLYLATTLFQLYFRFQFFI